MGVFSVHDVEGNNWFLGIRDMASKSADDTLDVFKEILEDISQLSKSDDPNQIPRGKKLLISIEKTMSDRAATEVKFNELLEAYINETLPLVKEADGVLDGGEMAAVVRLDQFFCGLHSLVHATESAVASHKEWESSHYQEAGAPLFHAQCARPGESSGSRFVQSECKALAFGGCEKTGCASKFMTYARPILQAEYGCSRNPFQKFLGARFNVLGRNAVYSYCLRFVVRNFLLLNATNMLLKSVLFDLEQDGTMAQVRVLGILSKLIFVPLWNVLEDKSVTMADMNAIYANLIDFFEKAAQDPSKILEGNSPFEERYIDRDIWLEQLLAYDEATEALTAAIMGLTMASLAVFAKKQFRDHLPGGIHENLTNDQCKGVPKTNVRPESAFAFWHKDRIRCPSYSNITIEGRLLWTMNKTYEWLLSLNPEKREEVIEDARKQTPAIRAQFREREKKMMELRAARLQERVQEAKEKEEREVRQKFELVQKVEALGGMWKSADEVDAGLMKVKESVVRGEGKGKQLEALKCQITFRKKILQQPVIDAKDWTQSADKKALDIQSLSDKLKILINQANLH